MRSPVPAPLCRTSDWFTSSYSSSSGTCVETRFVGTAVQVRDSKHTGPTLSVPASQWTVFLAEVSHPW